MTSLAAKAILVFSVVIFSEGLVTGAVTNGISLSNSPPDIEPAAIPSGLDAYREWARWPSQRIGMRAYMRSTYDRRGGNEGADASHFLYQ
ncbi:MAG TPA: hypothetical protein VGJ73_23295, partial [Verrucomicrobiae bacterium]